MAISESFINKKLQDLMRCIKDSSDNGVVIDYTPLITDILAQLKSSNDFEETVWVDKNTNVYYIRERVLNQGTGLFAITWKLVDGTSANPTISNLEQMKSVSDYELVSTDYKVITSGAGYVIGDILKSITIINTSDNTTATLWRNETQNSIIATPIMAHLQPISDVVLLNGSQRTRITNGVNDASVKDAPPNGTEQALVVRNIPSGVQNVEIITPFIQEDFGAKAAKNILIGGEYIENLQPLTADQAHALTLDAESRLRVIDEISNSILEAVKVKLNDLATEDTLNKLNNKFIFTPDGIKTKSTIVDSNGDIIDNFAQKNATIGNIPNSFQLVDTANFPIPTSNVLRVVLTNIGNNVASFSWNGRVQNLNSGRQWYFESFYDRTSNKYTPVGSLLVSGDISNVEVDMVLQQ